MLQAMVESGNLLSVKERIPNEPPVIQPAEWLGVYREVMTSFYDGPLKPMDSLLSEFPTTYDPQRRLFLPNVFTNLEWSDDLRTLSFTVRRGIRWSDGEPFGLDDVEFWFRTVTTNPELSTDGNIVSKVADLATIRKMSGDTIVLNFATPNTALFEFTTNWPDVPYRPSHYLRDFHPSYTNPDIVNDAARNSGFSSWQERFMWESSWTTNADIPTIFPWKYQSQGDGMTQILIRNPYYWKVDVAGNQLPYFDYVYRPLVKDKEAFLSRAFSTDDALAGYGFDVFPGGLLNEPRGQIATPYYNSSPSWSSGIALLQNYGGGYPAGRGDGSPDSGGDSGGEDSPDSGGRDHDNRPRVSRMFVAESDNHTDMEYRAHGAVVFRVKAAVSDDMVARYGEICRAFVAALESPDESVATSIQMVTAWPLSDAATARRLNGAGGDPGAVCRDAVDGIDITLSEDFLHIALEERDRPDCLERVGPFLVAWSNHHDEVLMVDMTDTKTDEFADVFVKWRSDIVDPDGWKRTWLEKFIEAVDRTASLLLWWVPGNPVAEGC